MKKIKCSLFAVLLLSNLNGFAQWTTKTNFGGTARTFSMSFTIRTKIYVGGGFDGSGNLFDDFWEYDQPTDTWTQKANFPWGARSAGTAFSIGNKGYLGLGTNGSTYLDDFWEYDPANDSWIQKANFPGGQREEAVGFPIGNKGYVGTGQLFVVGPNSTFTNAFDDFYEYNPATDTWTQKANFPGAARAYAVGIECGGKGYIGLGGNNDQTLSFTDFYSYNDVSDTWAAQTNMPGVGMADAGIFAIGTDFYVVGGINFPGFSGTAACRKFSTVTNTWSPAANYSGGIIIAPVTGSVNGKGYVGTGFTGAITPRTDWKEFSLNNVSVMENEGPVFSLYPVPAGTTLTAQIERTSSFSISIKNVEGQVVLTQINEREINVSMLTPGTYFIEVEADGKISSQRFLKE